MKQLLSGPEIHQNLDEGEKKSPLIPKMQKNLKISIKKFPKPNPYRNVIQNPKGTIYIYIYIYIYIVSTSCQTKKSVYIQTLSGSKVKKNSHQQPNFSP